MSVTLYEIGQVSFRLLGTNGLRLKPENERFIVAGSPCRQNLKYENFTLSFGRLPVKNCIQVRAARAAREFFLIQPIRSLFSGVVVDVAIVVS